MPSLMMKTKSTAGSLRENNGLHVCQKPSKISKNSSSHVRNVHHDAQLETCTSKTQDDSFCNKATVQEIRGDETNSSTIETIFSPILESIDKDNELSFHNCEGREKDIDVPISPRENGKYQSCNVLDFFISDTIVSSSQIERNSAYTGVIEAACLSEYKCDELSRFSGDGYMLLPFLEDSIENGNLYDDCKINSEPFIISEDPSLYLAIHQLKSGNQEADVNCYTDWDPEECFDPQMFIRNLLDLSETTTSFRPHEPQKTKSVTLVLDLDETLLHSSLEHCDDADFTCPVYMNLKEHTVYVKQRPYLRAFLERVSEMFQIVVFTASQSVYAKQLLDVLDPDGKMISRRAYRESCIYADGIYIKDLAVLGVDLAKIAIIDNSPQAFRLQVNNGIPIKSWFSDPTDCALISLLPFLERLADAEDVRPIIATRFGNKG